mmetsp:Transcript_2961/g.3103  ORF Transcript_2961/g.3103 Transcript_2961/m.3103 type:complete len:167 (+) Transcript_2961:141-641(+)
MKEYIRKNTPLAWFSDHPIVSAVLWILGHDMTKQKSRIEQYSRDARDPYSPNNGNKSPGLLSWKDDHGGNIAEYIQEVQGKTDSPLYTENMDDTNTQMRSNREQLNKNDEIGPAECTPSPQWGFYIPITPPIDQVYSSSKPSSLKVKSSQKSSLRQTQMEHSNALQ